MPIVESKALRVSEAVRSIPSSNIKFRVTETIDPTLHRMVHSKETMEKLPKFLEFMKNVTTPTLQSICEDLKAGVKLEVKKKKGIVFMEKIDKIYYYLKLKSLNQGFANFKGSKVSGTNEASNNKSLAISKLFSALKPKIAITKCSSFYNLKSLVEPEFNKTIKDKIFGLNKMKTSPIRPSFLKERNDDIKESQLFEEKEKVASILEKIQKKCVNLEKVSAQAFLQWKITSLNLENQSLKVAFLLKEIFLRKKKNSFLTLKRQTVPNQLDSADKEKIIKLFSMAKIFSQQDFLTKLKTFQKLKPKATPFDYKKKLTHLKTVVQNLKHKNLFSAMVLLKSLVSFDQVKKNEIVRRFVVICASYQKIILRLSLWSLKGEVDEKKIQKIQMNDRMKGKILLSSYKHSPCISLKTAFLRFRVRGDAKLVKKAIDRLFVFYYIHKIF